MSAARILAANLHALGRPAARAEFDDMSLGIDASRHAIQSLRALGLIRNVGGVGAHALWEITPAGVELVEGRLALVCGRHPLDRGRNASADRRKAAARMPRAHRLVRTWLGSLPQGIRL